MQEHHSRFRHVFLKNTFCFFEHLQIQKTILPLFSVSLRQTLPKPGAVPDNASYRLAHCHQAVFRPENLAEPPQKPVQSRPPSPEAKHTKHQMCKNIKAAVRAILRKFLRFPKRRGPPPFAEDGPTFQFPGRWCRMRAVEDPRRSGRPHGAILRARPEGRIWFPDIRPLRGGRLRDRGRFP